MSARSFGRDAAIVVLAAFALIEAASMTGISPGPTSIFVYPVNSIVSIVIVLSSFLGVYGVLTDSPKARIEGQCKPKHVSVSPCRIGTHQDSAEA